MLTKENIKKLIDTLKGIHHADYNSMDRLVACVSYLEALLSMPEEKKTEEVTSDG